MYFCGVSLDQEEAGKVSRWVGILSPPVSEDECTSDAGVFTQHTAPAPAHNCALTRYTEFCAELRELCCLYTVFLKLYVLKIYRICK